MQCVWGTTRATLMRKNGLNSAKCEPRVGAFAAITQTPLGPGKRPFVVPRLPGHPINIMDAS